MSRPNFIELCARLTAEDEKVFEHLWRYLGLSVDWAMTYATIGRRAQRMSQLSFLRLLQRGLAYQLEAPTLWDVDFRTAVAQAELEDREQPGAYHRIRFATAGSASPVEFVEIDTTRPELIPACVALVAHPDDERYKPLFGTEVVTPLFGVRVPVRAHALADPEKGTGIAMICTFGDITDVTWWRELGLPVRADHPAERHVAAGDVGRGGLGIGRSARARSRHYDQLAGLSAAKARARIVELLRESRRSARRAAADHARGQVLREGRPSARDPDQPAVVHQDDGFSRGAARDAAASSSGIRPTCRRGSRTGSTGWPATGASAASGFSACRFRSGTSSSRRNDRSRRRGCCRLRIGCRSTRRPTCPDGLPPDQRDQPGGFAGDPDIMDTWATSSLTPQIAGGWGEDPDLFARVFPMDVRPQAHDIIRTWLFDTVLRVALRARHAAVEERGDFRMGARSRSQEDVEVEGQRRDADGAARGARLGWRALLGGERPTGHRHGVRSRAR